MSLLLESPPFAPAAALRAALGAVTERLVLLNAATRTSRFHMLLAWTVLGGFCAVDAIWLSLSPLRFARSNWDEIGRMSGYVGLGLAICGLVTSRLRHDPSPIARTLRQVAERLSLTAMGALIFCLLASLMVVFCCLGSSAAFPFQDGNLARLDAALGFRWPAFLAAVNSHPAASWLLVKAYQSTAYMLCGTVLWLGISGQRDRLCEFLALLCLTSAGLAVGMLLLPAEGAYAHYRPAAETFSHFSADAGMWHHTLLMTFRTGIAPVIDFTTPNINCLVTFPSGHTVLAIIITFALRKSLWTLVPAALVNATMIVSTLPEGGHHLMDLVGGMTIALAAITVARYGDRIALTTRIRSASRNGLRR